MHSDGYTKKLEYLIPMYVVLEAFILVSIFASLIFGTHAGHSYEYIVLYTWVRIVVGNYHTHRSYI